MILDALDHGQEACRELVAQLGGGGIHHEVVPLPRVGDVVVELVVDVGL